MWGLKLIFFTEVTIKAKMLFLKSMFICIGAGGVTYSLPSAAFPVVTNVDVNLTSSSTATYTVSFVSDPSLDNLSALKNKIPTEMSYFGIFHRHKDEKTSELMIASGQKVNLLGTSGYTWLDVGNAWTDQFGKSGTVTLKHTGVNGSECAGFLGINQSNYLWNSAIIPPIPAAKCIGTPPVNNWCALKTPEITLNYGTLTSDKAVGTKKSANVIVECTDAIDYTLRLRGKNEIPLTNGMNVTLTANNSPLISTTLKGTKGDNSVVIEGTLNGTPVDGAFSGSEVLMVSYP
ncbi:hypothetical protein GE278_04205 [Enterobacteriaceae bacterium Kacie_13]|nr:hypothetical protein GE278_04205 [Enterobacteriaceae bacterium Kacie_13]